MRYIWHTFAIRLLGRVVHVLLQLSERWPCHFWLIDNMKFASFEAKGSAPFSLSHSSVSLALGEVPI